MEEILTQLAYAARIPEAILTWGDERARIRQDIHEHPDASNSLNGTRFLSKQNGP